MMKSETVLPPPIKTELFIDDECMIYRREQEISDVIDINKDMRDNFNPKCSDGWRLTHNIPAVIVEEWLTKYQANLVLAKWNGQGKPLNDDAVKIARLLNDPEYAYLRTSNLKTPLVDR